MEVKAEAKLEAVEAKVEAVHADVKAGMARLDVAQGESVILHCHWLSFLMDLHSDLTAISCSCCPNHRLALG